MNLSQNYEKFQPQFHITIQSDYNKNSPLPKLIYPIYFAREFPSIAPSIFPALDHLYSNSGVDKVYFEVLLWEEI